VLKWRLTIHQEYQAQISEFGRIGDSTFFNGMKLLRAGHADGTTQITFQAGITGTGSSQISLAGIATSSYSGTIDTGRIASADFDRNGENATHFDDLAFYGPSSLATLQNAFQNQLLRTQVTASDGTKRELLVGFASHSPGDFAAYAFLKSAPDGTYTPTTDSAVPYSTVLGGGPLLYSYDSAGHINGSGVILIDTGLGTQLSLDLNGLNFRSSTSSGTSISNSKPSYYR